MPWQQARRAFSREGPSVHTEAAAATSNYPCRHDLAMHSPVSHTCPPVVCACHVCMCLLLVAQGTEQPGQGTQGARWCTFVGGQEACKHPHFKTKRADLKNVARGNRRNTGQLQQDDRPACLHWMWMAPWVHRCGRCRVWCAAVWSRQAVIGVVSELTAYLFFHLHTLLHQ